MLIFEGHLTSARKMYPYSKQIVDMKKIVLFALFSISLGLTSMANDGTTTYPVAVSFGSMAGGPVSDAFLKKWVINFNKLNKTKVTAVKYAGCGREGEYAIMFSTGKISGDKRKKFLTELKKTVSKQEKINRAEDKHAGNMDIQYNVNSAEYEHCRLGAKAWL
jgi:hypothetical protein